MVIKWHFPNAKYFSFNKTYEFNHKRQITERATRIYEKIIPRLQIAYLSFKYFHLCNKNFKGFLIYSYFFSMSPCLYYVSSLHTHFLFQRYALHYRESFELRMGRTLAYSVFVRIHKFDFVSPAACILTKRYLLFRLMDILPICCSREICSDIDL